MVKISDVARQAGVSPATVSRVLNGSVLVTEEKRARVLAASPALRAMLERLPVVQLGEQLSLPRSVITGADDQQSVYDAVQLLRGTERTVRLPGAAGAPGDCPGQQRPRRCRQHPPVAAGQMEGHAPVR